MAIRRLPVLPLVIGLLILLIVSAILATGFGPSPIPPDTVLDVLRFNLTGQGEVPPTAQTIVWNIRAPRVLLGCSVGAGLAVAGTVIQTLVRNPLADPYLLGISSGASVGATAVITLGLFTSLGSIALTAGSLVGALGAATVVFGVAMAQGGLTPLRLVLTGTVLSSAFSAIASFLVFRSQEPQAAQSVLFWLLGSLTRAKWGQLAFPFIVVTVSFLLLMAISGWLDALANGPDVATSLGVPVRGVRNGIFVLQAGLVGVLVAVSGGIGFVGLIVPHLARLMVGARHKVVLPVAMLTGSLFLVWVDVAARIMAPPMEVPLGVVTGLVGAPVFLILLGRRHYHFGGAS
ncbi:iron ABC transporter permease [Stomatohabitans albus]|uniref:FecCD family ABC transporter permease n=1 Tax=Stomatohabitans albus TaxID=3110766 RepID=UPI00300DB2D4